jgi:energy-converting hydrogenase Eha subunit E
MLSAMQYPYWLMIAGAALVVIGFIGFAFSRNRNGPVRKPIRAQEKTSGK